MFRGMRRFKQLLPEEETRQIIAEAECCIIGLIGDDGYPYTVPVNHVLVGDKIYFHSAKQGHKIDALKNSDKVSVTVVAQNDIVSREYTSYFRSAHVFGKAHIVEDAEEFREAFKAISERYCMADMDRFEELMLKSSKPAVVICIDIEHMAGKESIELVNARKK